MNTKNLFLITLLFCFTAQIITSSEDKQDGINSLVSRLEETTFKVKPNLYAQCKDRHGSNISRILTLNSSKQDDLHDVFLNFDLWNEITSYLPYHNNNDDDLKKLQDKLAVALKDKDVPTVKDILITDNFLNTYNYGVFKTISPLSFYSYKDARRNNLLHLATLTSSNKVLYQSMKDKVKKNGDVWNLNKKNLKALVAHHKTDCIQLLFAHHSEHQKLIKKCYDDNVENLMHQNLTYEDFSEKLKLNAAKFLQLTKSNDIKINKCNKYCLSPLMLAYDCNNIPAAHILRSRGASLQPGETGWEGWTYPTPLHYAVKYNNEKEVINLIKRGQNVNCYTFEELFDRNITYNDLDDNDLNGCDPLNIAIENNNYNIAKLLIEHGAFIDKPKLDSFSIESRLQIALNEENLAMIALLLEYNANVYDYNKWGSHHLEAILNTNVSDDFKKEVFQLFMNAGFDVTAQLKVCEGAAGKTILHKVFQANQPVIADFLLKKNIHLLDAQDSLGQTPLHSLKCIAQQVTYTTNIKKCQLIIPLLDIFLKYGGCLDKTNINGDTALHLAIRFTNIYVVSCLLQRGANIDIKNNKGMTALDEASTLTRLVLINKIPTNQINPDIKNLIESFQKIKRTNTNYREIDIDAMEADSDSDLN